MADSVTLGGRAPLIWTVLLTVLVMCIGPTLGYAPEFAGFLVFLPHGGSGRMHGAADHVDLAMDRFRDDLHRHR